ncbi:MAG: hypothetical protein HOW97_12235 [Catenulispora sp.]|nr:hypothetical protein [Catenulispora sp.]
MTQLARYGWLGMTKEASPGVWQAPTIALPYSGSSGFEDMVESLRDESVRNNDSVLQGWYQGPIHAEWSIDVDAYPDLLGHFLAATIGPDTVTAATSTTLSVATTAGATSIQTPVSLPAGTVVKIDTAANIEYAWTDGVATGSGPYISNITTVLGKTGTSRVGLSLPHTSTVAVVTPTTHTFKQNPAVALPTYSLTYWDTVQYLSCSYARFSDLQVKIDPKGKISLSTKAVSFPSVVATATVPAYTAVDPLLGWSWNLTDGGAASTRGLSYDGTIKRATEAISSSDGTQTPREVFAGAIEYDATLKVIHENTADLNLFLNNTQMACTVTAQQPVTRGGQSLTLTASKSAWTKGKRDMSQAYAQADYSISAVANTTDGGVVQAVLANWQTAQY